MTRYELQQAQQRIADRKVLIAAFLQSRADARRKENQYGPEPLTPSSFMAFEIQMDMAKRRRT
jgi:hypothetical protein